MAYLPHHLLTPENTEKYFLETTIFSIYKKNPNY